MTAISPPCSESDRDAPGSVDDGKSTLIGRLLYDSKAIFEDQLTAVEQTSRGARVRRRLTCRC
jgi:sulfate adenylyltransferase subunit 1 (EFTu-like GTPase family)